MQFISAIVPPRLRFARKLPADIFSFFTKGVRVGSMVVAALLMGSFSLHGQELPSPSAPFDPLPDPSPDVLTPNRRSNTPDLKIGLRVGVNTAAYSNDRYLDNTLLDVGQTEGELDVYTTAAGFGYNVGVDIEYPTSPGFSWVLSATFDRVSFRGSGPVNEPCEQSSGAIVQGSSFHEFNAKIDFLKISPQIKLSFQTWYLLAGAAASHPFSSLLERTRRMGETDCFFPGSNQQGTITETGEIPAMQGLHYAIRLGGGLIHRLSDRLVFAPELILDFGSSRLNKSPDSDLGIYTVGATIRYDVR